MARPIRIGNCSGFFGDRSTALAEIVAEPDIDVVTGDYLAEVTMLVLAKTRAKQPDGGYAASFLAQLEPALATIADRGIKVVTNAGGLNPHGLADAVGKLLAAAGHPLSVAVVDGDDVSGQLAELQAAGHAFPNLRTGEALATWPHEPLTANAYLGGWGIARALAAGADIVITGRVTDASVVVGPAAWWHGWGREDFDQLAGAVVAGHLIECGTQVTGGNYSGFTTIGADVIGRPAFPIAEIAADGSSVIAKASGRGAVTVGTATAQLLYEIGSPAYLNPDVTAHFDTVRFEQAGPDRVAIGPVSGSAPPPTTKVAITALGGFRNQYTNVITGLDVEAKVGWYEAAVRAAVESAAGVDSVTFERLGTVSDDPADQGAASMLVRTTVTGTERGVGRPFGAAIVELALANIPGFYGLNLPGVASSFGTYWPGLLDQSALDHRVTLPDGSVERIAPSQTVGTGRTESSRRYPSDAVAPLDVDPPSQTVGSSRTERSHQDPPDASEAPLGLVADARSGDKGGDANVGVWVRDLTHWEWLRETLTVDLLRRLLPEAAHLDIDRYELPLVGALNFVVHDLLGEGATANVRADNQAKALGEYLRAKHVPIPADHLPTQQEQAAS